ncbi:uncharacterized protein TM35_000461480 [Trypanosoma theileri]|uniref:Uncharacterized protein n=1 Tax=Trypanosoma theileri TaxID=67003 RepID=A0A1X0NJH0_9TRYP|nr:uncharacterized protein TM35_000461480 [Trypanosoma theileri]ORC84329.1 hypothetical protein TM35_000461480 [Trypanosoma theileri]
MGDKPSVASAIDWDVHSPPDSPFIANPAMAQRLAIAPAYVRRMEEAQRRFAVHEEQQLVYNTARTDAAWTVALQCGWLGVGGWLTLRGYRYADPVQSLVSGMTSNRVLSRLFTPVPLLGMTIAGVTAVQLRSDVQLLLAARRAWQQEENHKEEALAARAAVLSEGLAEAQRLAEEGKEAK